MSRPHPLPRYTFEDYDSFDRGPNGERFELVDGAIIAMVGGISAYNLIISNIQMALNNAVRSPCRVYRETFRLRVNDDSFYPDIFITCQPIAPNATQATDASVVVEVASDSTRIYDATTKLESYSQLPSIQEIVLVEIETRLVTVHRPRLHQVDTYTEHDAIALARWSLRLADIYAGIDL